MASRKSWRIPVSFNISCYFGGRAFRGKVTDVSEYGMHIDAEGESLPEGARFEIAMPLENDAVHLFVRLIRSVNMGGHNGLGVELLNPSLKYRQYVESLLYVM